MAKLTFVEYTDGGNMNYFIPAPHDIEFASDEDVFLFIAKEVCLDNKHISYRIIRYENKNLKIIVDNVYI